MSGGLQHVVDVVVDGTKRTLSSAPPTDQYLPWNAPGVETPVPDEEQKIAELKAVMARMQQHNFDKHRRAFTATHVKTQGVVKGTLTVKSDLPAHLQQGIFATPGKEYKVAARYANEPYLLQDDHEAGPRGMAMKVFGVTGERLPGDDAEGAADTQDFFFNNAPMIELTDLDTCLAIMKLREQHFDNPTALGAALKLRTDAIKQHAPYQLPNTNMISHALYTQSAFRFGEYYGHMALFPIDSHQKSKTEAVESSGPHNALGDKLTDFFASHDASYEFRIQLGTSPLHHPTEDASVVWSESTAPYQTLATLQFPAQNSFDHSRRVYWESKMTLSPWRGLVAHTPLGSINRLRRGVYGGSRTTREEINAVKAEEGVAWEDIP